jgi:hypothetical protein
VTNPLDFRQRYAGDDSPERSSTTRASLPGTAVQDGETQGFFLWRQLHSAGLDYS